jgi:hypothetical protein
MDDEHLKNRTKKIAVGIFKSIDGLPETKSEHIIGNRLRM